MAWVLWVTTTSSHLARDTGGEVPVLCTPPHQQLI
jgi:hypothetical protein